MLMNPMDGPLLKIERADYHIGEIEGIFRRYISANAKAMRPKKHRNARQGTARIGLKFPRKLPAVIGDAIHNLRVALDHAYWIMVEDNGGEWHKSIKFPFFDSIEQGKNTLRGYTASSKPNDEVLDFIFDDLQPAPGGRHELYDLHTLDITDKHKLLIPSRVGITLESGRAIRMFNGEVWRSLAGPLEGGSAQLVLTIAGGGSLVEAQKIEYNGNLQHALSILFGEGEFENRPVLATLRMLRESVTGAVKGLAELHSSATKT